jgi:hypothetical protein
MNSENFVNRPFEEVAGGQYDDNGFYYTPNGSFWDPDGVYFKKDGFDIHRGYYNSNLEYIPGPGWIDELLCYEDEKDGALISSTHNNHTHNKRRNYEEEIHEGEDLDDEDELYDVIDYDRILEEEEKKFEKLSFIKNNTESYVHKANQTTNVSEISNQNFYSNDKKGLNPIDENKSINAESLFNQIPQNKKQILNSLSNEKNSNKINTKSLINQDSNKDTNINFTNAETHDSRKEKKIEVDSLFS